MQSWALALLQALTQLYDLVTWPVYYFLYTPAAQPVDGGDRKLRAKRLSNEPDSPWRCVEAYEQLVEGPASGVESLADVLLSSVAKHPARPCLGTRQVLAEEDETQASGRVFKKLCLGDYHWETYEEVHNRVENLGRGLLALGLQPQQRLLVFAETRAEWQICVNAAFRFNFPVVTLYSTLGEDALVHGVTEAEVSFVVTSDSLLPKVRRLLPRLPAVQHVVYMDDGVFGGRRDDAGEAGDGETAKVHAMTSVERLGKQQQQQQQQQQRAQRSDLAVIMYTSGSTGLPKGVMLTHGNLMATVVSAGARIPDFGRRQDDVYIGYLPLAHVLELAAELACISAGISIGYSSPLTLSDLSSKVKKGTKGDISVLRPTLMAAVPAIMDRISKNVWETVDGGGAARRALFNWAFAHKRQRLLRGLPSPLLDAVVFNKVKSLLGGRLRTMLSGGAPLSPETQRFMNVCFSVPIVQGYGLTETTGAGTFQTVDDISTGRVGPPLSCCQIRLRDWSEGGYTCRDLPCPRGEILVGGYNIALGYFRMPDKTREDFFVDDDGMRWFCTGDIGVFNLNGTLQIVDRKKDLVKLQGGEYVSLAKVETALGVSAFVEQLCVYGDSFKDHVVVLVVPKRKQVLQLAEKLGLSTEDFESLLCDEKVKAGVLKDMQARSAGKVERFEIPTKIFLTPEPWTSETGLVTDALKLRRRPLQERFQADIDRMYSN